MRTLILLCLLPLAACAGRGEAPKPAVAASVAIDPPPPAWRDKALPEDAARIDAIGATWTAAVAGVPPRARAAMSAEGRLVESGAALDHPALPPGAYRCRLVRIGAVAGRRGIAVFPPYFCNVGTGGEEGALSLAKQTGSDLPAGWLHADGEGRYVFLGARQAKPGDTSLGYGDDRAKDVAGVLERIGAFRWRLTVPSGAGGLELYELTPVPVEAQPS